MGKGMKPAAGECLRCEGPLVITNRDRGALLCARCLRRPGLCPCAKAG